MDPCSRCGQSLTVRCRRGLCRRCFREDPGPSVEKDFFRELPLPEAPTEAWPGTVEKLAVMESRAAGGRSVFHPSDPGRYSPGPSPS